MKMLLAINDIKLESWITYKHLTVLGGYAGRCEPGEPVPCLLPLPQRNHLQPGALQLRLVVSRPPAFHSEVRLERVVSREVDLDHDRLVHS